MTKLSRKQITEGLKQTPIEQILVGVNNADKINLTKKQKDFARKVAEGKPKAQAYREAYNSQGKPTTQAVEAHKLSVNPKVASMIEAFSLANEAREYLIPAQIRTMAIQNLVGIAIDEGEKTSNKLKALELIGKMSEVALFTERKELIHTTNSADIKEKLLEGLRLAFSNSRHVNDLAKRKAESLLVELSEAQTIDNEPPSAEDEAQTPTPCAIDEPATPLHPRPQESGFTRSDSLHSNPLNESPSDSNSLLDDLTITAVIVTNPLESDTCEYIGSNPNKEDGEGVIVLDKNDTMSHMETPPVTNSNEKG
jgi:hypothetical protein